MELYLLCAFCKTLCKCLGDVWFYLLQLTTSCLPMGDSSAPGVGQEGLATLTILGMDYPLVASFLEEFINIVSDPVFLPYVYYI